MVEGYLPQILEPGHSWVKLDSNIISLQRVEYWSQTGAAIWKIQIAEPLGTSMSLVGSLKVKLVLPTFLALLPVWSYHQDVLPHLGPRLQGLRSEVSETISWNTLFFS